ncbi:MAG TPA: tetratricopeptide repeat protein [bacterium]|nr:tetratricopeptide repeat protein [bacterium]
MAFQIRGKSQSVPVSPTLSPVQPFFIWFLAAIPVLLTLLAYLPILGNDFVNSDDTGAIVENTQIRYLNGHSLQWMFTTFHMGFWIPLTWLSLALDYQLGGLNPLVYHLDNLILHALNTTLVFFLSLKVLKRTGNSQGAGLPRSPALWELAAAFLTATLFGLHPLHVESVAWAVERKDVLYGFFYLLGLSAYMDYVSDSPPKKGKFYACLAFALLSLMAKPMAVTFPLILLLLDFWPLDRWREGWRRVLPEKIPFFLMSFLSGFLTVLAHNREGAVMELQKLPLDFRLANAFHSVIFYLEKMLCPVNLSVFYPVVVGSTALSAGTLAVSAIVVFFSAVVFIYRGRWPYLTVSWAYYLTTLLPVLGLLQVGSQAAADRFTYLPSLGPFLFFSALAAFFLRTRRLGSFLWGMGLALSLGFLTYRQVEIWRDSVTLWENVVRLEPDNSMVAYTNLASAYDAAGRTALALVQFDRAISIGPPDAVPHNGKAIALCKVGRLEEAIPEFKAAIALDPRLDLPHFNLWIVYQRLGRYAESLEEAREAARLAPNNPQVYDLLGISYGDLGLFEPSLAAFRQALAMEPANPEYQRHLAATQRRASNPKEKIADYQRELEGN